MPRDLDFSLLPSLNGVSIFATLDPDLEAQLASSPVLSEPLERAQSAVRLFGHITGADSPATRASNLRGGLGEFYSISESVKRAHRAAKLLGEPYVAERSANPLVHLMLLLRHINVHAGSTTTRSEPITVRSHLGEPHDYTYQGALISDLTPDLLLCRHERRRDYTKADVKSMVAWLLESQAPFGISFVLEAGVESYCHEFLAAHEWPELAV